MKQTTLKQKVRCSGIGLHSGKTVSMTMRPAPADSGIIFYTPGPDGTHRITPQPDQVIATGLATTIGSPRASISTVEHLLAAIRGLEIDNIRIDVHGGELPIMDGSAKEFVDLFLKAGIKEQNALRKVLAVKEKTTHAKGDKFITAEPYDGFLVDYTIDFNHPLIGVQQMCLEITPDTFQEISSSRTFGFLKEVEYMHSKGLALGGSLENSVVVGETEIMNPGGLRYSDEFVRHKILDFIGDMAMIDLPLRGKFTLRCSGHALNNEFLRMLDENRDRYLSETVLGHESELETSQEDMASDHIQLVPTLLGQDKRPLA